MTSEIRRLAPEDAATFKALHVEALKTYPDKFLITHAEESARSLSDIRLHLAHAHVLGAFMNDTLTGMLTLSPRSHPREAHRAALNAFYVKPDHQGTDLARKLLDAACTLALTLDLSQIELRLAATNARAAAFYLKNGFIEWGRLPAATDRTDDIFMYRLL